MKRPNATPAVIATTVAVIAGVATILGVLSQVLKEDSSPDVIVVEPTPRPVPTPDIDAQVQRVLLRIKDELGADVVWIEEYFLTMQGESRGFSHSGSRIISHVVKSSPDLAGWIVLGQRFTSGPSPGEPDSFISLQIEMLRVDGFYLVPTTNIAAFIERQLDTLLGKSFYGIAGYDVRGSLVICVCLSYFREQTTLIENDLRRSVDDVQEIVALLTG